jgi:hypothetical protein
MGGALRSRRHKGRSGADQGGAPHRSNDDRDYDGDVYGVEDLFCKLPIH